MQWVIIGSGFVGAALQTHLRDTGDRGGRPPRTAPHRTDRQ